MQGFLQLDTEDGMAYVRADLVVLVSQPFVKPGKPALRSVGMAHGFKVFALDTRENLERLGIVAEAGASTGRRKR